jgi:hypothetical protein
VKHKYVVQPKDTFSENQHEDKTLIKTEPIKTSFSWEDENIGFLSDSSSYEPLSFDKDFTEH